MKNIIVPLALALVCLSSCGSLLLTDKNEMEKKSRTNDIIKIADYFFAKEQFSNDKMFDRILQFGTLKKDSLLNRLVVDTVFAGKHGSMLEPWHNNARDTRNVDAVLFDTRLIYLKQQVPIMVLVKPEQITFIIGDGLAQVVWTKTDNIAGLSQELIKKTTLVLMMLYPKHQDKDLNSRQI